MALAGIWSPWRDAAGDWQRSCAVITTPANTEVATLHDRMPAILPADAWDLWLDPTVRDTDALQSLLVPWDGDELLLQPVSRLVNRVVNEGPALLRPDPPEPVQTTLFDA
jgi:putative SOS response-associated peptidase YedK